MKLIKNLLVFGVILALPIIYASNDTSRLSCEKTNSCNMVASLGPEYASLQQYQSSDSYGHNIYAYNGYGYGHERQGYGHKVFVFDPNRLTWYAYDGDGSLVASGIASGGRQYCPDIGRRCKTPIGTFRVHSIGGAGCRSSKFPVGRGGAPMPYCMFFSGGYAIHGSYELPNYNASHGCIRVEPRMAEWLSTQFITVGTTVIVKPY